MKNKYHSIKFILIDRIDTIEEISVDVQVPKLLKLANQKQFIFKELYLGTDDMVIAYSKEKFSLKQASIEFEKQTFKKRNFN